MYSARSSQRFSFVWSLCLLSIWLVNHSFRPTLTTFFCDTLRLSRLFFQQNFSLFSEIFLYDASPRWFTKFKSEVWSSMVFSSLNWYCQYLFILRGKSFRREHTTIVNLTFRYFFIVLFLEYAIKLCKHH